MKTINDLPSNISLGGVKFKHPETGETCYWQSQWNKGVWYKKDIKSNEIFPLFVEVLTDALNWEIFD